MAAAALAWNRGTFPMMQCPGARTVAEFDVCWPPVKAAIDNGSCLVYSVGIAADDAFSRMMAASGCEVHGFDPTSAAATGVAEKRWPRSFHYHPWGFGSETETRRKNSGYGSSFASNAKFVSLAWAMRRLGHAQRRLTILKIDCEGCEWDVSMELHTEHGAARARRSCTSTRARAVDQAGPAARGDALLLGAALGQNQA